jgi:hypothetical protein
MWFKYTWTFGSRIAYKLVGYVGQAMNKVRSILDGNPKILAGMQRF